jgi:Domain of unknown function (DUF4328)
MNDNPYSPPQAHVADFSPALQREQIEGFRDLAGLVRWLKIALAALALIELAHAVSLWLQIGLLSGAQSGGRITHETALANDGREGLLSILYVLAYFLTSVLFLRWTYLVKKNAMALGASYLEFDFSPGWSVGYYFVPLANLVAPYRALKETFQASHPEFRPHAQRLEWSDPPKLLPLWWALWLANGFLAQGIFEYSVSVPSTKSNRPSGDSPHCPAFRALTLDVLKREVAGTSNIERGRKNVSARIAECRQVSHMRGLYWTRIGYL